MYKKIIFFILISLFITHQLNAQSLSGTVINDSTHQPVEGASVYLPQLKLGSVTDAKGNYKITSIPKGTYEIEVSSVGYATLTKQLSINEALTLDFTLSESATNLCGVICTCLGNETVVKRAPIPVTVVSHDMILEGLNNTVIDAISKQPGVNATTEGPGTTKPQINGLGFDRVLVLTDGLRQEDFQWGDDHGILIDPYAVYDAEVIRGPASLQYGASAEAGVISFKSQPFAESGTIQGSYLSEYHTNNGYIGNSFNIGGNKNGLVWSFRASSELAHDYQNPKDGYVWGSAWQQENGRFVIGINKSWGFSRLTISALHRRIQVPDGNRDSAGNFMFDSPLANGQIYPNHSNFTSYDPSIPSDKILNEYQSWWQNSFNVGKGNLGVDIGFTQSVHHDIDTGTVGACNILVNDIPYSIKYQLENEDAGFKLTTGINGTYEFQHNMAAPPLPYSPDYEIPDYNNFQIGGYGVIEKQFDKLTLSGGLRYDVSNFVGKGMLLDSTGRITDANNPNAAVQFTPFNNTYTGFSGSIGATYQLDDNNYLKLNVSRSFRAPAINELTSNGQNIGSNAVQLGNINLKAEQGYQVDVAYGYDGKDISFEADGFYNHINNFIFGDRTNAIDSSSGLPIYQFLSTNVAILTGVSGYLNIHPKATKWLEINNGFTYIYTYLPNQTDSTQHIPWIAAPHITTDVKLRLNDQKGSILKGTFIKLGLEKYWAQNDIYSAYYTEIPSAAYTLFNAGIGTKLVNPKTGREIVSLYINGSNLTNVAYADHLNLAQYFHFINETPSTVTQQNQGVYNMGRNFSLKVVFPFGTHKAS